MTETVSNLGQCKHPLLPHLMFSATIPQFIYLINSELKISLNVLHISNTEDCVERSPKA